MLRAKRASAWGKRASSIFQRVAKACAPRTFILTEHSSVFQLCFIRGLIHDEFSAATHNASISGAQLALKGKL